MSAVYYLSSIVGALPIIWFAGRAMMHYSVGSKVNPFPLSSTRVIDFPDMKEVFDRKPGLRQDIKLFQSTDERLVESCGTNRNGACIAMHRAVIREQPAGARFFLRREIFLINREYHLREALVKAAVTVAPIFLFDNPLLRLGVILGAYSVADLFYSRAVEEKAAADALQNVTYDELSGALCILKAAIKEPRIVSIDFAGVQQLLDRVAAMRVSVDQEACDRLAAAYKKAV